MLHLDNQTSGTVSLEVLAFTRGRLFFLLGGWQHDAVCLCVCLQPNMNKNQGGALGIDGRFSHTGSSVGLYWGTRKWTVHWTNWHCPAVILYRPNSKKATFEELPLNCKEYSSITSGYTRYIRPQTVWPEGAELCCCVSRWVVFPAALSAYLGGQPLQPLAWALATGT